MKRFLPVVLRGAAVHRVLCVRAMPIRSLSSVAVSPSPVSSVQMGWKNNSRREEEESRYTKSGYSHLMFGGALSAAALLLLSPFASSHNGVHSDASTASNPVPRLSSSPSSSSSSSSSAVHVTVGYSDKTVASVWRRLAASIIDVAIFTGMSAVGGLVLAPAWTGFVTNIAFGVYVLAALVWFEGQTLGKKLVHVQVLRVDGSQITIFQAVVRNVCGLLNSLCLMDALWMFTNKERRAIHDLAAGTVVVMADN